MNGNLWVGTEEVSGIPSMPRPDAPESRWSLQAIAAVERPHHPAVSPDGSKVLFLLDRDTSDAWTVPVSGGPPCRVTTNRDPMAYWEDTQPVWSPDGMTIAYGHDGHTWLAPSNGGKPRRLCPADSPRWIDDRRLLVTVDRDGATRLAKVSIDDPWPEPLSPPEHNVGEAEVVPDSAAAVYVNYPKGDLNASEIWWVGLDGSGARKLTGVAAMHDLGPAVSADGRHLAFTSERSGWYQAHVLDLGSGEERQLTEGDGDLSSLEWHPDGQRLAAVRTFRGRSQLITISFPEGKVTTIGQGGTWSTPRWAEAEIIAVYEDHRSPASLFRVGSDGSRAPLLGPPPLEVVTAPHVSPEEVAFSSHDGLEIHGFLFRPAREGTEPVPAVVYPHGGPTDAYTDGWDGHAQYFIDKGYAWFAVNFRGSTGYGRDFERSNHGVWGVADTEDCLAAADYLARLDWVDPSRIAIFGASYGSYMALASMTNDPQHRFACAVLKYGDSDITTSWAQGDRGGREDLERMMGTPASAREAYRKASPLGSAGNIKGPLLIAHGERDERVHPDQSAQLAAELKRLGKAYEYVTYPTEGHGLLRAGPQVDFYRRLERFLDWHLM